MMFGWGGNPHFGPFHLLSTAFIVAGFWLLAKSWPVQYEARRARRVAHTGPYARIRHPQYVGFIAIMFGFLLQWPTLITVVMFPILLAVYARLASGTSQDSCRLIHATNRSMSSACMWSRTTASRSGLSVTAPTGVQSRVPRDQRAGFRSRAWRYV